MSRFGGGAVARSGAGFLVVGIAALAIGGCDGTEEPEASAAPGEGGREELSPSPLQGPQFEEAVQEGDAVLRVVFVPSSGFAYEGEGGELTGVTVELLRSFARFVEDAHGVDVELEFHREEEWARFYDLVRSSRGGVFGIGNVTITEERREELAFSPPYLRNVATIVTHEDEPELSSMDDVQEVLAHLTGLSYPGTLHEERMETLRRERLPDLRTVEVTSNDELVGRVASGDGYFGYIDIYNYWAAVEEGLPIRRHGAADDASEEFGVIMPLDSDWEPVMEEFFRAHDGILGTEWYGALLGEHLGPELARLLDDPEG